MNGFYGVIIVILSFIVSMLWKKAADVKIGKAEEKAKEAENRAKTAEAEKQLVKDITPVVVEYTEKKTAAEVEYEQAMKEIEKAYQSGSLMDMMKIASEQTQKALSLGAKEKQK